MTAHRPDGSDKAALSPVDDESQPFLDADLEDAYKLEDRGADGRPTRSHGVTPIPKAQLATLCIVRLVDPIMFTQIFPYVNEMMDHLHLTEDPSKTGLYSGLVVSNPLVFSKCCAQAKTAGEQLCRLATVFYLPVGAAFRYVSPSRLLHQTLTNVSR